MQKLLLLLILLVSLISCTSTKVMTRTECDICLSQSDGVLLLPLAWDRSFSRLSSVEQNELERQILAILQDQGFTKVEFYNQLDYELLSARIKDLRDPEQRAKISGSLAILIYWEYRWIIPETAKGGTTAILWKLTK